MVRTLAVNLLPSALFTVWISIAAQATTLYVATNGSDSWSGLLQQPNSILRDGPLRSLQGARDAIRRLKRNGTLTEPVRVTITDGTYQLSETLLFTPQDSGTARNPIVYEAAPGARPVFTGGRVITGFREEANGVWTAQLPEVGAGQWYFDQLFVNGRRAVRARSPNKLYYFMVSPDDSNPYQTNPGARSKKKEAFRASEQDIVSLFQLPQGELEDVIVVTYQHWSTSHRFVVDVDAGTSWVLTSGRLQLPYFPVPRPRYHLENFHAALDSPGEWFLGKNGTLHYMPLPGEDMTTATVVAPVLQQLIHIEGQQQWVEHITFRGLRFYHNQYQIPPDGWHARQAAETVPAAIHLSRARYVTLEDCEIAHLGTYGVWIVDRSQHNTVSRCYLHDLGAGGVRIGDANNQVSGFNSIDNNIIHSGGHRFESGMGMLIQNAADNRISHNDVGDFLQTGISVGWSWGYKNSHSKRNTIEFNRIHHLGWGVMDDIAGVYTLGVSPGTVIRNNVIHDVTAYQYGGWGLCTDEGSSYILLENNLVYNTSHGGFHQHYGKENVVRNNIFAFGTRHQLQRSRKDSFFPFWFVNNIVYGGNESPLAAGPWEEFYSERNVVYNSVGTNLSYQRTVEHWQRSGWDFDSVVRDPQFIDAAQYDFRLAPDSPALALGFQPFDYSSAGVYGSSGWVALARSLAGC